MGKTQFVFGLFNPERTETTLWMIQRGCKKLNVKVIMKNTSAKRSLYFSSQLTDLLFLSGFKIGPVYSVGALIGLT
ncbi:hypothetical protein OAQ47_04330 [Paracoccaceae bacterium]|nr:hypothetical protein [Paracoccaceae bacterium]MDA9794761.1 hypothetical protein [Paracoccaceae bacterium]MDC0520961.1 hypothetical protein [bacterium]MDC0913144.1 hypothetical protein [Paracoccaceae bacterium]